MLIPSPDTGRLPMQILYTSRQELASARLQDLRKNLLASLTGGGDTRDSMILPRECPRPLWHDALAHAVSDKVQPAMDAKLEVVRCGTAPRSLLYAFVVPVVGSQHAMAQAMAGILLAKF